MTRRSTGLDYSSTGLFVHAAAVSLGVSAVLLSSAVLFEVVRLAGAGLLIAFGALSLWSAARGKAEVGELRGRRVGRPYVSGLMTNLISPKATLFFLAALPQFVPAASGVNVTASAMFLAVIAGPFSAAGLSLIAVAAGWARGHLSSMRARRVQEATMGVVLIGLGAKVAAETV